MPVQWINRFGTDFRGISGSVIQGAVRVGDEVRIAETGASSRVARLIGSEGDCQRADEGEAVTVELADPLDVSRGHVLTTPAEPPKVANAFQAHLVWVGDESMIPGRSYWLRVGTAQVPASVSRLKHRIDLNSAERISAKTLATNEIGVADVVCDRPVAIEPYAESRTLGGCILVDRMTNETVAAGMIDFELRRSDNTTRQDFSVTPEGRAANKGHRPAILWFTGLSGAGKSTIANVVDIALTQSGHHTFVLDGDNLRHGLNRDLGFTDADRVENIRRTAYVARLMADAGLIVLASLISPFRRERMLAREIAEDRLFLEIHVDAPLELCEQRDSKGLYRKARKGALKNFTGIDSVYEVPETPDLKLDATSKSPEQLANIVLTRLEELGFCLNRVQRTHHC